MYCHIYFQRYKEHQNKLNIDTPDVRMKNRTVPHTVFCQISLFYYFLLKNKKGRFGKIRRDIKNKMYRSLLPDISVLQSCRVPAFCFKRSHEAKQKLVNPRKSNAWLWY